MKILKKQLEDIPKKDCNELLQDYEEHFEVGMKKGRKEEALAKALGDPKVIAKQIKADYRLKVAEKNKTTKNIFRAIYASLGLGFFNIIFVLGPFIALLCVILALFIVAIAVIVAGLAAIIFAFIPVLHIPVITSIGLIFIGIGVIALGMLFFIGNGLLLKLIYTGTISYLKWNARIITGGRD
jgi:uncharacterized membrane protein